MEGRQERVTRPRPRTVVNRQPSRPAQHRCFCHRADGIQSPILIAINYAHDSGNVDEKYQTLIATGQQPDVFFSSSAGFKYYVARGVTVFLDDLAKKDKDFKETDYDPW